MGAGRLSSSIALGLLLAATPAAADPLDVAIGKATFDRLWVPAPASTKSADGLGPLSAARSCASCHAGGGRTRFRLGRDDPAVHPGLVVRLADPAGAPDPVYGAELQPQGAVGAPGEGRAALAFSADGKPLWRIEGLGYGALGAATAMSARVAPSLRGMGLLTRVPEAAILALADPDDRDGDGVSGRPHRVEGPHGRRLGRFGWKASEPTLATQSATAFALDLGLSTTLRRDHAGDCTDAQEVCRAAAYGGMENKPEVAEPLFAALVTFLERRPAPPAPERPSRRGASVFAATGCAACHAPSLPLAGGGAIAPYTDLLLHDLGDGLDDGAGEAGAKGSEWRTAPLWGLSAALAQGSGLLHDGRAADVKDAVRWHGGEASSARERFEKLSARDRKALIEFVNGL